MSKYFTLFLFFFTVVSFSQNSITIKGKIIDKNNLLPLEEATVYITSVKDSSVVDYTISDKNGFFKIETSKISKPVFLKISYLGYQTFIQEEKQILENKDFGVLHLLENANVLGEVIIKSETPPIRIKKDTLEFNASSFKVRPDANVETLLKQLPGVEITADGKITVNGKEVNQVLVNGKPFFDKEGKIALQNLPSDLINKVQISDTKTKKEELSGQASSANTASINLTIDEDKNKGFFGKFMGGYGTNDRYESSALVNYFKNKRKISVLASSNNINSSGFSMDEVFDSMGGGRNQSFYSMSDGSFGIGNMRFGGGKGISQSDMLGVNYSDEWHKDLESSGSYFFSNANANNVNRTKQLNFLPTGDFTTESNAITKESRLGHNFNFDFEYKIDSTASLSIMPKFVKSSSTYANTSLQSSKDSNNLLLNESNSKSFDENQGDNFNNRINFNKSFKRKGRFLNLIFENEHSKEVDHALNQSATLFYNTAAPDDVRNQTRMNQKRSDSYFAQLEFTEPIQDSLNIRVGADYKLKKMTADKSAFDFDAISGSYDAVNPLLTSYTASTRKMISPYSGFSIERKSINFNFTGGASIAQFDNVGLYLNNTTILNKDYLLPYLNSYLNLKLGKSKSIWMSYSYDIEFPSADEILPVENLANPLSTFIGNPDLDPNKNHSGYFSFRDFNTATRSGYNFYFGGDLYDNQVVSSTIYDASGKRTTSYENVSGTYTSWFGANWNKSLKIEAHQFKLSLGVSAGLTFSKGFTNGDLFDAKALRLTPRINFTYEYGELLTINPSYNFTYNDTKYTNYLLDAATNVLHVFNIQTTNYWPKNWVFGNDFGYTFNSNIADGFKKDFYLWNTSLSYAFFGKKMTAKVKVYDLLNQNQSATRTITPSAIRDEENIVLKRYLMFSLTYKIERFAGKEKPSRGNRIMF